MLSCKLISSNKTGEIVASSWWFNWIVWWCTDLQPLNWLFPLPSPCFI
jgi:hypothetical protein